ncbi:MAG: thioredoxin domain-containing protein, partial [Synechococcaceae cyanobacterium]
QKYERKLRELKLHTDENTNIPSEYGNRSITTLLVFKGGEKVDTVVGAVPKSTLSQTVSKYVS